MVEENNFQEINITSLWHKNLFESLQKLQDYERICRDGAVSYAEYLQLPPARIPEIQYQHLKMMASETGILIGNAKAKLSKEFYIKATIQIKIMKQTFDLNPTSIFIPSINQQSNFTTFHLSEQYYEFLNKLGQLREELVRELADILYGKAEEKISSMDKSRPLTDSARW